jgi:hypothetical protein
MVVMPAERRPPNESAMFGVMNVRKDYFAIFGPSRACGETSRRRPATFWVSVLLEHVGI